MITESDIMEFTISCYRKSDRKGQNNKRKVTVLRWLFVIEKEDLWKISFMDKVGVPHTLRDVGIPASDIEKMPMRL